MIKPYTERQKSYIVNNIVSATKNIEQLNETAYKFLYLACGFIAHYNRHGFKAEYDEPGKLRRHILNNQRNNQWTNFSPSDTNYAYYMSKKEIYNRICEAL